MPDIYLQSSEINTSQSHSKGKLTGQKPPLKPSEVWSIRVRLQMHGKKRDLALFNLAIDSKLRSCDLVALRVNDVSVSGRVKDRAVVVQQKTGRPVQFELTEHTPPLDRLVTDTLGQLERLRYSRRSLRRYRAIWQHLIAFSVQENLGNEYSEDLAERFVDVYRYCQLKRKSPGFRLLRALPATNNQGVTTQ